MIDQTIINNYTWIGIEEGPFTSAAGGGESEQKGVAAVEILWAYSEHKISGTATGHNGPVGMIKKLIWIGIEEVITALTRNQVTGNRPWVRIPPYPPKPWNRVFRGFHYVFLPFQFYNFIVEKCCFRPFLTFFSIFFRCFENFWNVAKPLFITTFTFLKRKRREKPFFIILPVYFRYWQRFSLHVFLCLNYKFTNRLIKIICMEDHSSVLLNDT